MIAVIVPCYNYGQFLSDAVYSMVGGVTCLGDHPGQDFDNFEIVIVDDASTDDSLKIARELATDERVRVVALEENGGTAAALNAGIEATRAQYVYILSADDMAEPWTLSTMHAACEANSHRVCYGDLQLFDGKQRGKMWPLAPYEFERVVCKNPMPAGGVMYPRECWQEIGGYPEIMRWGREGWAFNVACGLAGWFGHHCGQSGYLYRWQGQNRSEQTAGARPKRPTPDGTPTWREFYQNQMRELFPQVYEGDMCKSCGGGRRSSQRNTAPRARTVTPLPGRDGFTTLEYIGSSEGTQTFWVEGTAYGFGRNRPQGYVDVNHVDELLRQKDKGGNDAFRVVA